MSALLSSTIIIYLVKRFFSFSDLTGRLVARFASLIPVEEEPIIIQTTAHLYNVILNRLRSFVQRANLLCKMTMIIATVFSVRTVQLNNYTDLDPHFRVH